jgi:hypothetical protein
VSHSFDCPTPKSKWRYPLSRFWFSGGSGLLPTEIVSRSWPITPRASTWSSCLLVGKESNSDRRFAIQGEFCGDVQPTQGHAAADRLRTHRLVAPRREGAAVDPLNATQRSRRRASRSCRSETGATLPLNIRAAARPADRQVWTGASRPSHPYGSAPAGSDPKLERKHRLGPNRAGRDDRCQK